MDSFPYIPFTPPRASSNAGKIDLLFWALTLNTIFFTALICLLIIFFAVRYRRGSRVDRSNAPLEHHLLELGWTIIPAMILVALFAWSTSLYFSNVRPPKNAMNIYVVGKQWMWKIQHPEGRWEMNELHVPLGRPVKLTMTSEDVIHSFFVPAFRIKMDVLPGKYTTMWFEPTRVGKYHLFCAEYCGTEHSGMVGQVVVMKPDDYERWLRTGTNQNTMLAAGERLFMRNGCSGCHGVASSVRAPRLEGIYGRPVAIQKGSRTEVIEADDRYIHDSIVLPGQEVAAGFDNIMPTYRGRLTEEEILKIIEYIKSLKDEEAAGAEQGGAAEPGRTPAPEEYRARTGFVPPPSTGTTSNAVPNRPRGRVRANP